MRDAVGAGQSLGDVLGGAVRIPAHRFPIMVQRAQSIVGEVRTLGGQLREALERKDTETLAVLRLSQEGQIA